MRISGVEYLKCIAVIRHGDYQQPDDVPSAMLPYGLTPIGIKQAKTAAQDLLEFASLHHLQLDRDIHTSRMRRAYETGQLLAGALGLDTVIEFDALAERSVGAVANLTIEQIESIVKDDPRYEPLPAGWKSASHFRLPFQGAESLVEAGERVANHLSETALVLADHRLKIIVGHGASIRHAMSFLGVLALESVHQISMYHCHPIYLALDNNGGWHHVGGEWKPRALEGYKD